MVTGGSALPFRAGVTIALVVLWRQPGRAKRPLRPRCIAGAMLAPGPWLYAADRMVGRPILTTNGAFSLYFGNTPAATERFVGIADTPLGKVANADGMQAGALRWIAGNPGRAARPATLNLAWFRESDIPSTDVLPASPAIFAAGALEVVQYSMIIILAIFGSRSRLIPRLPKWIIPGMVIGFWRPHAATCIIPRYRNPVMPLLIVIMAIPLATHLARFLPASLLRPFQQ